MKAYKIVTKSSMWSYDSVHSKIEQLINKYARQGWQVNTVSFSLGWYGYYAHATLEKDLVSNDYV